MLLSQLLASGLSSGSSTPGSSTPPPSHAYGQPGSASASVVSAASFVRGGDGEEDWVLDDKENNMEGG